MHNYKLTIAYDGTRYHGWQRQPGVHTVQGELERALSCVLDDRIGVHGSGRTDRGVHAEGQVAHFIVSRRVRPETLQHGVNALVDPDIRILDVEEVSPDFHSRHAALSRTYRYHIWRGRVVHPFDRRFVHPVWGPLDADAMDKAARLLLGSHDFTSFASGGDPKPSGKRVVYEASWERDDRRWIFTVRANGFLRTMVRTIVGTLLEVGSGQRDAAEFGALLPARDRTQAGPVAPACGLRLVSVDYGAGSGAGTYRP